MAADLGVHPETEAGVKRLRRWPEILRQHALYSRKKRRLAQRLVTSIAEPDPESAYWLERGRTADGNGTEDF